MDRRLFLALAGASLAAPWPARAWPAPVPLRRLNLVNVHTGETFDGPYRDDVGPIGVAMDIGVVDFLASVMDAVGATHATVLSAYRTRETNAMLARTTFGVADNSQHIYGRALDIRLASRSEDAMQAARAMRRGGVGWYPRSGFFHIDTGPVRNWTLNGGGFDRLLLEFQKLIGSGRLAIAPQGKLLVGRARQPLTVRQRLALHHALAKAEFVATRR